MLLFYLEKRQHNGRYVEDRCRIFLRLQNEGIKYVTNVMCLDTWVTERVEDRYAIPLALAEDATWLKPTYWNVHVCGYDAAMVLKRTHTVRFVQLATALLQPFHIEYFSERVEAFAESPGRNLEIFFIAEGNKLAGFRIHPITGQGLLTRFGWPKGEEIDRALIGDINPTLFLVRNEKTPAHLRYMHREQGNPRRYSTKRVLS
ncbi:hypothetical protein GQ600_25299 [Phytophthora cactorum]|nr:hypothetical protein GQ600_25299 [Phytophthora cactorum]